MCTCPKSGSWFPTSYVVYGFILFYVSEWKSDVIVPFVDIGWIVHLYCLILLFIKKSTLERPIPPKPELL
jgi:hypothetical protein